MNADLENFYLQKDEPERGCLLALREMIMSVDPAITHTLKYSMPFFCYQGKMFCYLWMHKTLHQPYLGIVEGKHFDHPLLQAEKRSRMKIMLFDAKADLPVKTIKSIVAQAIDLYKSGKIKTGKR